MGKLIHYYKTYKWAREVGFSEEEARQIAHANWQVDILKRGDKYVRGRHLNTNLLSLIKGKPTQLWYASYHFGKAVKTRSLKELGISLHSLQDLVAHGGWLFYGYHWKGPWRINIFGRKLRLRQYDPDTDLSGGILEKTEALTKKYLKDYLTGTSTMVES